MIYVDKLRNWGKRIKSKISGNSCHMITDGNIDELHEFAQKIGLSRSMFQPHPVNPHYDLSPAFRTKALNAGAFAISDFGLMGLTKLKMEAKEKATPATSTAEQAQDGDLTVQTTS